MTQQREPVQKWDWDKRNREEGEQISEDELMFSGRDDFALIVPGSWVIAEDTILQEIRGEKQGPRHLTSLWGRGRGHVNPVSPTGRRV